MTAASTRRGGRGGFNDKQHQCPLPLDHPKRCMFDPADRRTRWPNHVERLARGPCRNYRLRNSKHCYKHATSAERAISRGAKNKDVVRVYHLPMFYSKVLTGTLKELYDAHSEQAKREITLVDEWAMMRTAALRAVALYNIAVENNASNEAVEGAFAYMTAVLNDVAKLGLAAAKVKAQEAGAYSGLDMLDLVNQTVRLIYDTVPDQYAKQLEQRMRDEIRLRNSVQGTTIAPHEVDSAVLAMDDTVPNV